VVRSSLQVSVAMTLACALGTPFVGSGVELVWLAEPAHSADRRSALFDSDEPTISAAAVFATVKSAPFVGVSGGHTDSEETRCREPDSNGEAK